MVTIAMKLRALALAVVATALLAGAPVHGDDRLGDENRILLRTAARAPDGQSTGPATPAWVRYAAAVPATAKAPMIALVIDDAGLNRARTERAMALGVPLTMAFMTYAPDLIGQSTMARRLGHDIMLHVPMEATDDAPDTGPRPLLTGLPEDDFDARLNWHLSRLGGYVGINNHMGSRFTADRDGMDRLMAELSRRGLMFLDSRTTSETRAPGSASRNAVPLLSRDVFLDNDRDAASVRRQLDTVTQIARARGFAIAIGHPWPWTLEALESWLPEAQTQGFSFVPVTALLRSSIRSAN